MNKSLLLLSLLLCANASAEIYAGVQLGGETLRGKTSDAIALGTYQKYNFKKHLSGFQGLYGVHVGILQTLRGFNISEELELSLNQTKKEYKASLYDQIQDENNFYTRQIKHQGNVSGSIKIGKSLTETVSGYIRPVLSLDRYQTKVTYVRFLHALPYSKTKTATILSYGLGIGLEKKLAPIVVGAEVRYMTGGTLKSSHTPYPNVSLSQKSKPSRYMALIKISYIF